LRDAFHGYPISLFHSEGMISRFQLDKWPKPIISKMKVSF